MSRFGKVSGHYPFRRSGLSPLSGCDPSGQSRFMEQPSPPSVIGDRRCALSGAGCGGVCSF